MRSVKRPLVLLAAGLALVLGACAAPTAETPTPPAEVTPASTEAPAPAEPPSRTGWRTSRCLLSWTRSSRRSSCGRTAPPASSWAAPPAAWTAIPWTAAIRRSWGTMRRSPWTAAGPIWWPRGGTPGGRLPGHAGIFTPAYQEKLLWTENMDGGDSPSSPPMGRADMLPGAGAGQQSGVWLADVPTPQLVSQSEDAVVLLGRALRRSDCAAG